MTELRDEYSAHLAKRHRIGNLFVLLCSTATWSSLLVLVVLLLSIAVRGVSWLSWEFLTNYDSRHVEHAGIIAGLWGSLWLVILTALFSVPVGIGAAIYLEEYGQDTWLTRLIKVNLANLAGVPSIVYGILGLSVFVRMFGLLQGVTSKPVLTIPLIFAELRMPIPFDRTIFSASLTLSLLILPIVIVSAQEALRAVPPSIRHASLALGATHWQTIRNQVLPASLPGIATGIILALSRAIGETAPIVMIGAFSVVTFLPGNVDAPSEYLTNPQTFVDAPFTPFTTLPIQIYNWISRDPAYEGVAAAGILILLVVLLTMNGFAIAIRQKYQNARW